MDQANTWSVSGKDFFKPSFGWHSGAIMCKYARVWKVIKESSSTKSCTFLVVLVLFAVGRQECDLSEAAVIRLLYFFLSHKNHTIINTKLSYAILFGNEIKKTLFKQLVWKNCVLGLDFL